MCKTYFLIVAGGSGTRLWPLSRKNFPKQFIKLKLEDFDKEKSFFQRTLERCLNFPHSQIIILTNERYKFYVLNQVKEIEAEQKISFEIVLEPVVKNTAPAVALGIRYALEKGASLEDIFVVLPSDHLISPEEKFREYLKQAIRIAEEGFIVTFGIKPTYPETGYGYIKAKVGENEKVSYFKIESFVEKPSLEKAKKYLEEKNYFWNSGMFAFKGKIILEEFRKFLPEVSEFFELPWIQVLEKFPKVQEISIDYAVMEKTNKAVVLPLDIFWSDIGSWESLFKIFPKDEKGNFFLGDVLSIDSSNSFVLSNKRLISLIGVENFMIVETEDAILISKKGMSQRVKDLVKKLREKKRTEAEEHLTIYKPWGSYTLLERGERYKIKRITVNPGESLSLQLHHHRSEHWIVVKGTAKVRIGEKEVFIHENESIYVPKSTLHRLENPGKIPLEIIEVQVGEYVEEDDIIRVDDPYGRSVKE